MSFPAFVHAQGTEKCSDVIAISKELLDSFRILKANLNNADKEIIKDREVRDEILKKYLGCEKQPNVADMLKNLEESLQTAEANRKTSDNILNRIETKIRQIIRDAHGKPVACQYYDPNPIDRLGTVVTIAFTIQDDKVVVIPSYFQLPVPAAH
jgi:hypothetical protein